MSWNEEIKKIADTIAYLEKRNKELEEQREMDIELFIGYQNKIRYLESENRVLKDLIPHQVDERG